MASLQLVRLGAPDDAPKSLNPGEIAVKIWFDTEFLEDGKTIELISIGMIREDGQTLYRETHSAGDVCTKSDWLVKNVLPHLTFRSTLRNDIAADIKAFAGYKPEFWAYYADYDWVVLCQLFGRMIDLPDTWPMYCRDLKQLCDDCGNPELPKQGKDSEHNALSDAVWAKGAWDFLMRHGSVAESRRNHMSEAGESQ